jgi:integral membrane protein (TIGR01906 family)
VTLPLVRTIASVLVAIATPCVVIAAAVVLFLNPIWVGFEQDRTDVTGFTGYPAAEVHRVTGSILSDLVFGPPNFEVAVNGTTVLDSSERRHMVDVRNVLLMFGAVALAAVVVLVVAGVAGRSASWFWRAVGVGGRILIVGVVVVGLGFAIFFEQAFELFHEIFFPPGTYLFDPTKEKLVQLFPDQFWSETSVGIAAAVLVLALVVTYGAGRIAARMTATTHSPEAGPAGLAPEGGSQ